MYEYGKVALAAKIRAKPGKNRRKLGALPDLMHECMKRAQVGKLDGVWFGANPSVV